jgi:ubiquinone/menaquinone biosynthesis C-methylase UbiE
MYLEDVPFTGKQFDLVTLHDVFEHLDHKREMIAKLSRYLRPQGRLLITFPPFYSAYGGHQQHLRTWYARLPFFHVVPFSTSKMLLRLRGEAPHVVEEIQKLGRLKMGMRKFEQIASGGGLRIEHTEAYIISPNHIRFGLRPLGAGPVARIPLLREVACSGVIYLLAKS